MTTLEVSIAMKKIVMPADKIVEGKKVLANIRYDAKEKRFDFDVRLVRPDGSVFRRAGSRASEADARSARDAAYNEFNQDEGRARDSQRTARREHADSLSRWVERVLPTIKADVAPSTFDSYRHSLENHILPRLGHMPLEEIKPLALKEHLLEISRTHSLGVASQARSALAKVMDVAAIDGRVPANPVKSVRISARQRKLFRIDRAAEGNTGKRWLTREEGALLLRKVRGTVAYWPVILGLRFGLRSGESMGLKWSDVDLKAKVVRVRRQAQCVTGCPRLISAPKSAAGVRDLPIATDLLVGLAKAKRRAEELGHEWVCMDAGRPLHPTHVARVVKEAVVAAGFDGTDGKPVPTSHDLRSSFLTWLANHANKGLGVKPHVLMRIAGHSDLAVTMKYYVGVSDDDLASAVNSLYMDLSEQGDEPAHLDEVLDEDA